MSKVSSRSLFLLTFLATVVLLAAALYLEHVVGLEPCPLCIVQRIEFIFIGLVSLAAAIHGPARTGQRVYASLIVLIALLGMASAGRQIWLQTLPADQLPACLPSLEYMLEAFPFQDIVQLMLQGTADCAEVSWTLFSLSLPEWSLLGFIGFAIAGVFLLFRRKDA